MKPWEKTYQKAKPGPWDKYAPAAAASPPPQSGPPSAAPVVEAVDEADLNPQASSLSGFAGQLQNTLTATGQGASQGMTFGWGDEIMAAPFGFFDEVGKAFQGQGFDLGRGYGQALDKLRGIRDDSKALNPTAAFAGEIAGALPTGAALGGQLAGRGASALGRMTSAGLVGAGQGAIYGAGSEDDLAQKDDAAFWGGVVGGGTGAGLQALGEVGRKVITPKSSSASQNAAADTMAKEGVILTGGQKTGSKGLQYLEAELGGGKAANMMDDQAEQFTAAVLKRAGIRANRATPEVIDDALTDIGQVFDRLEARSSVPVDQQMRSDLAGIVADYLDTAGTPARGVQAMADRIEELAVNNKGILKGEALAGIRSKLGKMIKTADGTTGGALREMQEVLDDAIERSLSPQLQQRWQRARGVYRNLLVVEKAVTAAGEKAADGLITPANLRRAAITTGGRRSFARGRSDFTELANAGVRTMTPLPQSGTAPRLAARAIGAIPAALGAAVGSPGGVAGMALGGIAGAAIPAMAGRALLSRPVRAYLGNRLLAGPSTGGFARGMLTPAITMQQGR